MRAKRALAAVFLATGCGLNVVGTASSDLDAGPLPAELDASTDVVAIVDASSDAPEIVDATDDTPIINHPDTGPPDTGPPDTGPPDPCAACPSGTAQRLCVGTGANRACTDTRRVFVSSTTSNGNMGGLGGADTRCTNLAAGKNLGGTWHAWVSSGSTDVKDRISHANVAYRLLDGTVIANDWNDLVSGDVRHGIDLDESMTRTSLTEVWTGCSAAGTESTHGSCNGFTSSNGSTGGARGNTSQADGAWTSESSGDTCDETKRLYCFEN